MSPRLQKNRAIGTLSVSVVLVVVTSSRKFLADTVGGVCFAKAHQPDRGRKVAVADDDHETA